MSTQSIAERIAEIKAAHKAKKRTIRHWARRSIGNLKAYLSYPYKHERHHACAALGTASKNTNPNKFNIRASKALRPESRFMKLRAFKLRYRLN